MSLNDLKWVGSKGVRFPSAYGNAFSRRGFALVLVLSFMVLLTIVVIAYLLSATNQNSIAHNVENTSEGKRLSDVAVQIVMGQIRQATTGGTAIAWASQPGMIRTYGTGSVSAGTAAASSQPLAYYKLYSSDNMDVTQGLTSYSPLSDVPSVWNTEPALFTDLNAPSLSASGTLEYPIIDPTAAEIPGASPNNPWSPASSPSASLVEGFSISSANTGTFTAPINYTSGSTPSATNNPAPMPVKWLFILQDGTVTAPTGVDGTGQIANWTSATDPTKVPSATNPIVARIAFWTDDETCKLNLNTAVGNTYWDAPMFETGIELEFSRYQPATNEFTRYPGHPSTTSLVPVLWSYGGLTSPDYSIFPTFTPYQSGSFYEANPATLPADPVLSTTASNYMQMVMNLDPRNAWGGSTGGTVNTTGSLTSANQISFSSLGTQRLYASVDEMLFSPPRTSRATANTNQFTFTNTDINKLRFFLTTTSRAPEVNMFNQPKISMWPIHDPTAANPVNGNQGTGTSSQSPLDRLLAFCSTINSQPYYFQRNDPTSSTADLSMGTTGGQRNLALYKYLETMLGQNIPGFGASFSGRYGTLGDEQILTECFDYIRSTINLVDGGYNAIDTTKPFKYAFTTPPGSINQSVTAGTGEVVPIVFPTSVNAANTTRGIGRFPTIKQVALMFIAQAANQPPLNVNASTGNVIVAGGGSAGSVTANPMHPWVGVMPASGLTRTFVGGTYALAGMPANTLYPTTNSIPLASGLSGLPLQTHAGLPFLTTMNPATGNFDQANPRYHSDVFTTALQPYQTRIQAMLLIDPVNVAVGFVPLGVKYKIKVTGLSGFTADGQSMGFTDPDSQASASINNIMGDAYIYGIGKIMHTINRTSDSSVSVGSSKLPLNFVSAPVIVGGSTGTDATGKTFQFNGGSITVAIQDSTGTTTYQTITLTFPAATFPTPLLPIQPSGGLTGAPQAVNFPPSNVYDLTPSWMLTFDAAAANPLSNNPNYGTGLSGTWAYPTGWSRLHTGAGGNNNNSLGPFFFMAQWPWNGNTTGGDANGYDKLTADTVRSLEAAYGDTRVLSALATVPSSFFVPHKYYFDTTMRSAHTFRGDGYLTRGYYDSLSQGGTPGYLTDAHTRNSSLYYMYQGSGIYSGAWQQSAFLGLPTTAPLKIQNLPSSVTQSLGSSTYPETTSTDDFDDVTPTTTIVGSATTTWNNYWNNSTTGNYLTKDFTTVWNSGGDFDNGPNHQGDGPYINKPDESFSVGNNNLNYPDFDDQNYQANGTTLFPPNRQVPSSVMFGSLPVFIDNNITSANISTITPNTTGIYFWRTLLFSPNPNAQGHPSNLTQRPSAPTTYSYAPNPPDFAFLDFFNMPAVQPYPISEPFSTAGRVNMNYQIAPFTYIKRDTAMRGVLRSTLLTAVPDNWMQYYKSAAGGQGPFGDSYNGGTLNTVAANSGFFTFRYPIHPSQTLQQFDAKFATGDIFRSPSEICSIWLYPATQPTLAAPTNPATALVTDTLGSTTHIQNWWYGNATSTIDTTIRKSLTGDNMRERPYANIYPQLTTKSNSYTVHYRVQILKKIPTTPANQWIENQDQIFSEYRGSSLIERYIDPNNTSIPDFATTYPTSISAGTATKSLDQYYNYHVVSVRKVSP
jgi:uncharacterized protein (TIGR02600 family)